MSISEQCQILSMNRSTLYYEPKPLDTEEIRILNRMDEIFTAYPIYGHRRVWGNLLDEGYSIGRDRVLKYMHVLGLDPIYPKKNTSIPNKEHKVYPYLLKDIEITRPNQVWAIDITYLRLEHGFCYFVAIIDWYSRYILSYRFSNTLDSDFCVAALEEALRRYPAPEIFNSDQGCQFTSKDFTEVLLNKGIKISMDSKGRALDNIIIERFFRTLKYEHVYLQESQSMPVLMNGIRQYLTFYNQIRKHFSLGRRTPFQVYFGESEVTEIKTFGEDQDRLNDCPQYPQFPQRKKEAKKEITTATTERSLNEIIV